MLRAARLARYLYFPVLIYGLGLTVKLTAGDLPLNLGGVHATMGAVFLLFGASVCYFVNLLALTNSSFADRDLTPGFWIASSLLFFLVFTDAMFGLHNKSWRVGLPEPWLMLFEGAILVIIVASKWKVLHKNFFYLFGGFVVLSGLAVLGDSGSSGEGTVTISDRTMSYEQTFETLSVLLLASAFTYQALYSLRDGRPRLAAHPTDPQA